MAKMKSRSNSIDAYPTSSYHADDDHTKHELFLQAFEKPTQIYRFLRSRHLISPLFLNRNLSYMKHRFSRDHRRRKIFNVDSFFKKVQETSHEIKHSVNGISEKHLTIVFSGIIDKRNGLVLNQLVPITADLIMVGHKKRKDCSTPYTKIRVAKCDVPTNPKDIHVPSDHSTSVTITKENFIPKNGHLVKSYSLILTASYNNFVSTNGNYMSDGISSDDSETPSYKKRKSQSKCECRAELVIFDKHKACHLIDGEYQIVIHENVMNGNQNLLSPIHRSNRSSWSSIQNHSKVNSAFEKGPVLICHVKWRDSLIDGVIKTAKSLFFNPFISVNRHDNENNPSIMNHSTLQEPLEPFDEFKFKNNHVNNFDSLENYTYITYQFLHNSATLQKTISREDFKCPWCSLNCMQLYSLLKHLKLCHSRLIFIYHPEEKGSKIEVQINENYDGSYSGNPHDLSHATTGFAFSRNGPVQRTPVTHILVSRSKKLQRIERQQSLAEFLDNDECDIAVVRGQISGHGQRLYYHTKTCIPITPQEMDDDSENENIPEWERIKTQFMIDEFTDVNEGEKEVMKLWNILVMDYGFVGDCHVYLACNKFVEVHWKMIKRKNLYKNFVLHLSNLSDFGLLSSTQTKSIIRKLGHLIKQSHSEKEHNVPNPSLSQNGLSYDSKIDDNPFDSLD